MRSAGLYKPDRCSATPESPQESFGVLMRRFVRFVAHADMRTSRKEVSRRVTYLCSRRLGERSITAEFRLVEHPAEPVAGGPHQPAKDGNRGDRRDVQKFAALHLRTDRERAIWFDGCKHTRCAGWNLFASKTWRSAFQLGEIRALEFPPIAAPSVSG